MSFATVFTLLLLIGVAGCSLYDPQGNRQLERYRARNKIIHDKLITENCTDPQQVRFKRSEVLTNENGLRLEVEKELFEMMIKMLLQCRYSKMATTQSTTTEATTTALPYPEECQNAINLTEEWRADNKGNRLNGMNNCDTQTMIDFGRPWFRFTYAAGNRLLNSCPPDNSCGTLVGMWSDVNMPGDVGVVAPITVYGSFISNCKMFSKRGSVLKCSLAPHDYVYKYDDDVECDLGFCA